MYLPPLGFTCHFEVEIAAAVFEQSLSWHNLQGSHLGYYSCYYSTEHKAHRILIIWHIPIMMKTITIMYWRLKSYLRNWRGHRVILIYGEPQIKLRDITIEKCLISRRNALQQQMLVIYVDVHLLLSKGYVDVKLWWIQVSHIP